MGWCTTVIAALVIGSAPAEAKPAEDAWPTQLLRLSGAMPDADPNRWTVAAHTFTEAESKRAKLLRVVAGDTRRFFVGYDAQRAFLGVVMFTEAAGMPVAVAVDPEGKLARVVVDASVEGVDLAPLVAQLIGRSLGSSFAFRRKGLVAVEGAEAQSKAIAAAAHEALWAMHVALGNPAAKPPG